MEIKSSAYNKSNFINNKISFGCCGTEKEILLNIDNEVFKDESIYG